MIKPRTRVWAEDHELNTPVNSTKGLIQLCQDYFNVAMVGCEVGCFKGASTEVFANFSACVHAVDPWTRIVESNNYINIPHEMLVEAEKEFDKLVKTYRHIIKHKLFSAEALSLFPDASLDYVYIDGAHDYESASFDIVSWRKKLTPGGLLMGHDWSAIFDVLQDLNLVANKVYEDDSWVIKL